MEDQFIRFYKGTTGAYIYYKGIPHVHSFHDEGVNVLLGYGGGEIMSMESTSRKRVVHFPNVKEGNSAGMIMGASMLWAGGRECVRQRGRHRYGDGKRQEYSIEC